MMNFKMTMSRLSLALAVTAGLATTSSVVGCADPEDIDRVQPDLVDKSALEGEWYALSTVVRAQYASADVFPGLQGTLERGIWQVEKDYLYFYRTYEAVADAEGQGPRSDVDTPLLDKDGKPVMYERTNADGTKQMVTRYVYRSAPIRKFPITGHYDVRRQYNPMTGEPSNVRVEDASEKFWFERNSMRVDFGTNDAEDYGDLTFPAGTLTIYEGEEGPEDIKLRNMDEGKYLDFVVRGFMQAPTEYLEGWGYVPSCLFYPWYTGAYYECGEEEIHIRSSYMRVPENNSYVPMDWNDHMLNKFGYYRSARSEYDELYGETYTGADRNIRRFRIWKDYVKGADGKLDYAQMEPQPVVYYLSEDFPRELIKGAKDLANQWNKNFAEVVETRKGMAAGSGPRMFVLCENSTAEADAAVAAGGETAETAANPLCKNMDQKKLWGDLRYNLLVSINDPVEYGLYGYGPMHSDPISGETVHANAFMYTANVRLGARNAVDMIEYEAGVQSFRDITDAKHIETQIAAKKLGLSQTAPKKHSAHMRAQDYALEAATALPEASAAEMMGPLPKVDTDIATARMNRLMQDHDLDYLWMNEDMAALAGLPVTQMGSAGIDTRDAQLLSDIANPGAIGSERMLKWKMQEDMERGINTMDMGQFFDDSFRGLALEYKEKYDRAICDGLKAKIDGGAELAFDFDAFKEPGAVCDTDDDCGENSKCTFLSQGDFQGNRCMTPCSAGALFDQLRKEIRRANQISEFVYWDPNALYTDTKNDLVNRSQLEARAILEPLREEVFYEVYDRIWSTVAMHEVGHNVGLRHNFASSTDALNYFPHYWDLKGHGDGAAWEPEELFTSDTAEQSANKMREYQQTSIMEYTGAFNARYQGLGSYDRAAILYGYGELAEVFDNPPAFDDWKQYLADPSDTDPDSFPVESRRVSPLAKALTKVHHTNFPKLFGGVDNVTSRKVVPYEDIHGTQACNQHDSPYDSTVCGGGGSFCQPFPDGFFCTKPDMVEVPFRFCSDEYNWTNPTCQTWDEGTDPYEIVDNSIADYNAYWPFWAYKRDNDLFNPMSSYWGRVVYEIYGYRKQFEHWALDYARYENNGWWQQHYGKAWHEDINGGLGATLAAKKIFTHLANMFGRPSDAYYGFNDQRRVYEPVVDDGANTYSNVFQIREDMGARPIYPSYDYTGYIYTPYRAGTFYDRLAALMFMTYPTSMFTVAVDKTYDVKRFRLNFATVWPQRVQNIFAGIIAGTPNMYGWCIEHDGVSPTEGGNGDPIGVKPRLWFGTQQELDDYYENCTPLNPEPQYDFPTTQYRLPALAAVYGFGWMSYTYDRSFIDRNRLWLEGDGSDITIPANLTKISFTDPFSGKTYVAAYDPNEEDPYAEFTARDAVPADDFENQQQVFWSAARLVAYCNDQLEAMNGNFADYQKSYLQVAIGRLEILRGLYRYFDFGF